MAEENEEDRLVIDLKLMENILPRVLKYAGLQTTNSLQKDIELLYKHMYTQMDPEAVSHLHKYINLHMRQE